MYVIQDTNNRFIKKTVDNKITFTYSESCLCVSRHRQKAAHKDSGYQGRRKEQSPRRSSASSPR